MAEWAPYKIKFPSGLTRNPGEAVELTSVHHISHLKSGQRILEDEVIRSGPVFDESRLNKSRINVSWVSANTWYQGSIYGSIRFTFPWSYILGSRNIYWVEAMPDYNPHAYRFLLTNEDFRKSKLVTPYDPSNDDGPLRKRQDKWYRHPDFTSEFMVEGDLDLGCCTDLDFVEHNRSLCRPFGSQCPERTMSDRMVGGRLLAFLLANDLHGVDNALKKPSIYDASRALSNTIDTAATSISHQLRNKFNYSGCVANEDEQLSILSAALGSLAAGQKHTALNLVSLLESPECFDLRLEKIIDRHFGTSGWKLPD